MRLSTGNKRQANHNGRIQSPRLKRKRNRTRESYLKGTRQAFFHDSQRDTNVSRHSGNVIREQGEEPFIQTATQS
jgi:hypothetical protein